MARSIIVRSRLLLITHLRSKIRSSSILRFWQRVGSELTGRRPSGDGGGFLPWPRCLTFFVKEIESHFAEAVRVLVCRRDAFTCGARAAVAAARASTSC